MGIKKMKPLIELWDGVGLGLILEWPTGVVFSNQTGGTSCLHPQAEGVYVPLRNDCDVHDQLISAEKQLLEYFEGPKHRGAGATRGLNTEDADFIEAILDQWNLESVRIDRSRLLDSHEAWVRVLVSEQNAMELPFQNFAPYPLKGVLTWSNSD